MSLRVAQELPAAGMARRPQRRCRAWPDQAGMLRIQVVGTAGGGSLVEAGGTEEARHGPSSQCCLSGRPFRSVILLGICAQGSWTSLRDKLVP